MAPWRIPARGAAWAAIVAVAVAGAGRAEDLFTVSGVTVDATAESAQAAQQQALAKGQSIALAAMFRKLTLEVDHARLPAADAETRARLVRGFEVTNERRSSLRYIAELTVRFDPDGVRAALRDSGIPYAETESLPIVVLPVLDEPGAPRLWAEPNPWRAAWRALGWRNRLVELVLPYGELADLTTVTAERALAGDEAALAALAARYGAAASLVAVARPLAGGALAVEAKRFAPAGSEVVLRQQVAPVPGEAAAPFAAAAAAVAETIERAWKRDNLLDFRHRERIEVATRLAGFADWLELRRRLEALSQITRIEVTALTTAEARLRLHYLGDAERLADAMHRRNVELVEESPGAWRLELRSAAAPPAPGVLPADPDDAFAAPPAPAPAPEPDSDLLFE